LSQSMRRRPDSGHDSRICRPTSRACVFEGARRRGTFACRPRREKRLLRQNRPRSSSCILLIDSSDARHRIVSRGVIRRQHSTSAASRPADRMHDRAADCRTRRAHIELCAGFDRNCPAPLQPPTAAPTAPRPPASLPPPRGTRGGAALFHRIGPRALVALRLHLAASRHAGDQARHQPTALRIAAAGCHRALQPRRPRRTRIALRLRLRGPPARGRNDAAV
jgi:hypothetical protein